MSLVAPADLETLTCSFCHKYLSVCPVTVFPDKRIKCGRASCTAAAEGTLSMYNLIADKVKFPCIYRYEGCEQLILSKELDSHETEQHSKSNDLKCCFCEDNLESTFFLPAHIEKSHPDVILPKPAFWMDLTEYKIDKQFFYRENDILVVVGYVYTAAEPKLVLHFKEFGLNNTLRLDLDRMHKFEVYFAGNNRPIITNNIKTAADDNKFQVKLSKQPNQMVLCNFTMWSNKQPDFKCEPQPLDGAASEAVLLFTLDNVKELKEQQTNISPFVYTVGGRLWRFGVRRSKSSDYGRDYLKVYLQRSCRDIDAPCGIKVVCELKTVMADRGVACRHFVDDHFYAQNVWDFIPWDNLVDSETGYVDGDGKCHFKVTLHVLS